MAHLTTVDRFGRVVIPKETRDQFGLTPGSTVTLVDGDEGILLKPGAPGAVTLKGGVLVFSGKTAADADSVLHQVREERLRRFVPRRAR